MFHVCFDWTVSSLFVVRCSLFVVVVVVVFVAVVAVVAVVGFVVTFLSYADSN